jgi:tetratricopeptide (TPR) repeat protein
MYGLISPSGQIAALCNADAATLYNVNGDMLGERSIPAVTALFRSFGDAFKCEKAKKSELIYKLKCESEKEESLDLLLTVLDMQIDDESKLEIASMLEVMLSQQMNIDYLRCCMYSAPLPNDFSLSLDICDEIMEKFPTLYSLLFELIANQPKITKARDFWSRLVSEKVPEENKSYVNGIYALSKIAYIYSIGGDQNTLANIKFDFYQKLKKVYNYREIIGNFFNQLDFDSVPVGRNWQVNPESVEFNQDEYRKQKDDSHQWKVQVQNQINNIKDFLSKGNINKAIAYTNSLVEQQINGGYSSFAAKSLGSLAEYAKSHQYYELMLDWTLRSTEVDSNDKLAWALLADAYLLVENFEKANATYDKCSEFAGMKGYSLAGKARIYRAMHDYETALCYIQQACEYDDDPIHGAIKAEILADIGRHAEAESLYNHLIDCHPDNVGLRCGLAAAVEEQNRFAEAEKLYLETIKSWPADQVPRTGLGCLLAKQGRFKEALTHLDLSISFSNSPVSSGISINAKAKALKMAGKYKDAETLLSDAIERYHRNFLFKLSLVEVVIASGDLDRAFNLCIQYQKNVSGSESDYLARMCAQVLKKKGHLNEALAIVKELSAKHPKWLQVLCDSADLLRGFGQIEVARSAYNAILNIHSGYRRALKGLRLLDVLSNKYVVDVNYATNYKPVTFEDWEDLNLQGLSLLANRKYGEAQKLLKLGKSSPFKVVADAALMPEYIAQVGLGGHKKVSAKINALTTSDAKVQRIIIHLCLGETEKAKQLIDKADMNDELMRHIVPLVEQYFLSNLAATNDAIYDILDEHVNCMLRAA